MASTSTSTATPIPPQLLSHPALQDHPTVLALHETHGGIPANPDAETLDSVLQFANSVASTAVAPGTKTRRTDPSPRRTARVWRSQLLGHRDPSVSPEHSPVRYRSRSRPPGTATVPEDGLAAVSVDDRREVGAGTGLRAPGKRDMASVGGNGASDLENRVAASIQQQHEFHDRLLQRFVAVEAQATQDHTALQARFDQSEARYTNKVNAYLGRALVPVSNGKDPIPLDLAPIKSADAIRNLGNDHLRRWLTYYTGSPPADNVKESHLRQALRACTGVDVSLVQE